MVRLLNREAVYAPIVRISSETLLTLKYDHELHTRNCGYGTKHPHTDLIQN